jgi:hypothetical protein
MTKIERDLNWIVVITMISIILIMLAFFYMHICWH